MRTLASRDCPGNYCRHVRRHISIYRQVCFLLYSLIELVNGPVGAGTCVKDHSREVEVQRETIFFPRVRTPCGHGAQVIVEGREKQSDGGEKNKDHKHNPKTTTKSPQAVSPPSCSLSSVLVKQVRRKRVSRGGLNSRTKSISAQVCAQAKSQKGFTGTSFHNYE